MADAPAGGPARPRVGVGVIVLRDGAVLLGRREGVSHGTGTWQFPGGHLEAFEDVAHCAAREVMEETGLAVSNLRPGPYTNDIFEADGRHYVTVYVVADAPTGTPAVCEPAKCAEWRWCDWHHLPEPLFLPIINLRRLGFDPGHA